MSQATSRGIVARLGGPDGTPAIGVAGFQVTSFDTLDELLVSGRQLQPRVCVVEADADGRLPPPAGTVRSIRRELPLTDVLYRIPGASAEQVRQTLRAGARDVLLSSDPVELERVLGDVLEDQTLLPRMLEEDRRGGTWRFGDLTSRSQKMWDVFETCIRTAPTEAAVLILGETGTGKELLAREIHKRSGRSGPFVPLNCGAVPDTLIDSELFGHVEGAFTGARKAKDGLFRHADHGTVFLDEIGNIPIEAQNRLLRTLQESTVRPVGGHEEIEFDARVIAATSTPLEAEIDAQRFREDLFYRIDVIRLIVPPLRERPEDLILLLGRFVHVAAEEYSVQRPAIGESFLDRVCAYEWPGNVRELENFVERLVLTHPGERLEEEHFEGLMRNYHGRERDVRPLPRTAAPIDLSRPLPSVLDEAVNEVERRYLAEALRQAEGRVGEAARLCGIHRRTLLRKMRRHGLDKADFRPS